MSQIRGAKDIVASLVSHFGSVVTTCSGDQSGPIRAMFFASKMAASAFSRYCKAQWGPIRAMFLASKMAARAFSRYCKAQWSTREKTKRARVLGQHGTGNCSAWQKMHQTWRTSYSKSMFEAYSKENSELLNCQIRKGFVST